ncbi:MAG TPA: LLM class flavin-dependent oxidoreductase [Streptosporangiaceae bacterium]|jgi:5,10-methylenetetrahydromethanopterin reductase
MSLELWTSARSLPGASGPTARRTEDEGWTGLTFTDSQNLSGDPYVALTVAAGATSRLRLGTGVTNPWTRHPAVTASGITSVDIESGGRAELGVGRGDSALAYLGLAPAPVAALRDYLDLVRTYLRGEPVPIERVSQAAGHRIGAGLPLGSAPPESRLRWVAERFADRPPVPVFVVASGPKVIRTGAELADRVTLAVGAEPTRLRWAVDEARAARADVRLGAYVNVVVDEDADRAREAAAGSIASFARFSGMHGTVGGRVSDGQRAVMEAIPRQYDMNRHFSTGAQASLVTGEFAGGYAILGPASYCVERLTELAEMGIGRIHVVGASRDIDPDVARAYHRRFVTEVLPRLI